MSRTIFKLNPRPRAWYDALAVLSSRGCRDYCNETCMILYIRCLCKSKDKLAAKKLKQQGYEIRRTRNNPAYAKEAAQYGLKLPIIVENGEARRLWM